ncbi:hypothetical protein [Agromyces seonyuensis]|uniref:TPM domain-containing protein n=1 Tax=Agromyces seonyuensis TaxID=2662446 RepID=A0A6I4P3D7_9MICO|nr:hypothetical protein [Agromyces seonyuensis]MWB99335.1 hypothetical protein [Agromyces seonyuensis]
MELVIPILVSVGIVVAGVGVLIGVLRSRASKQTAVLASQAQAELAQLEQTAGSALVRTDEKIRLAADELGFAAAEFGETAIGEFTAAIGRARQRLAEAFQLNQLLADHIPDTDEQRRDWNQRIIALCESADASLGEQVSAFAARRAAARATPAAIERLVGSVALVRSSLAGPSETLQRLAERYTDAALAPVAGNPAQAARLLDFAGRSAEVARSRLAAGREDEAEAAVRAGDESVHRASALLANVESFEVEALRAESTLAAMIAESHAELAVARAIPAAERQGRLDDAIAALEASLAAVPVSADRTDPIGALTSVRQTNTALDDAVAERADRAERQTRLRTQLVTAIDDAELQITAARDVLARTSAGPDARTRLAAAEHELADLTTETDPERALGRARRAAALANEAALLAHQAAQSGYGGYGYPGGQQYGGQQYGGRQPYPGPGYPGGSGQGPYSRPRGRGGDGMGVLGGVLGGLAIGGMLDGLGDLGDFGDFFD